MNTTHQHEVMCMRWGSVFFPSCALSPPSPPIHLPPSPSHPSPPTHPPTGVVHPNLNLTDPESEVDLNILVGDTQQHLDIDVALSNSFGFGGHNSCVMFRKFTENRGEEEAHGGADTAVSSGAGGKTEGETGEKVGPADSKTIEVPSYFFRKS